MIACFTSKYSISIVGKEVGGKGGRAGGRAGGTVGGQVCVSGGGVAGGGA